MTNTSLKRRIGPGLLTAYGLGVMIGAGIYVLVGGVAAEAGTWAPIAFLVAGLVAAPTALSYAELSTRLPEAGGEVAYVDRAFANRSLPVFIGVAIVLAGIISAAAVLRGGVGYLTILPLPADLVVAIIGAGLTAVAAKGVLESFALAALFTVIEIVGLGLVVWAGTQATPLPPSAEVLGVPWGGIAAGAALAFFAFIGFEDIVNIAEEVRDPAHSMPRAILTALILTTLLYALVTWAALRVVPPTALAESARPLALVWQAGTGRSAEFLSAIAVLAALNGVLAQIVMAARVLYGLGARSAAFAPFRAVNPNTGTPLRATLLVGYCAMMSAVLLPVATLAEMAASVLLAVFVLINLTLLRLQIQTPAAPFRVPRVVPILGAVLSGLALAAALWDTLGRGI